MDNTCARQGRQAAAEALGRPWGGRGGGHSRWWGVYGKSTFNALVISDDTDAVKTQRICWLSQICECWSGVEQSTELSLVGWNSSTGQGIKIALMATICQSHPDSYNRQLASYFVVFFPATHSFPRPSGAVVVNRFRRVYIPERRVLPAANLSLAAHVIGTHCPRNAPYCKRKRYTQPCEDQDKQTNRDPLLPSESSTQK